MSDDMLLEVEAKDEEDEDEEDEEMTSAGTSADISIAQGGMSDNISPLTVGGYGLEEGMLFQYMDIQEPLTTLQSLLEHRFGLSLSGSEFWLQDSQKLDPHSTLVEQCVQGKGIVQVNVKICFEGGVKKINILDVLKPADEGPSEEYELQKDEEDPDDDAVTRWVLDPNFVLHMEQQKMPQDPEFWKPNDVVFWLRWAIKKFRLQGVKPSDWRMSGKELLSLSREEFMSRIPHDPGHYFWTHFELLKRFRIIAVVEGGAGHEVELVSMESPFSLHRRRQDKTKKISYPLIQLEDLTDSPSAKTCAGSTQLWQFLLELLTDHTMRSVIQWVGEEGEFKLHHPDLVAQLWGRRKNKPKMNYEKLSRALRYYYDGDMISKVHGKRFVYRFVCDLRQLIGYSAAELNRLVTECALKKQSNVKKNVDGS